MGYLNFFSWLNADRIKYGTIDGDRLPDASPTKKGALPPTGTPSGKYLKDDGAWSAVEGGSHSHDNLTILNGTQESFTTSLKGQYDGYALGKQDTLGFTPANESHNHDSSYETKNANIQTHVTSQHAPTNAQKNSDITQGEIEAKLTGEISSHSHAGGGGGLSQAQILTRML